MLFRTSACLSALIALMASTSSATCFTVYNNRHELVYRSALPPVNMSLQIHETLLLLYPDGGMVFSTNSSSCQNLPQQVLVDRKVHHAETNEEIQLALDNLAMQYGNSLEVIYAKTPKNRSSSSNP